MRRLLIDDIRRFKDVCHSEDGDTEVVARNYNDGVELLKTNTWDELYLDHDLGDYSKTGYDVMCWLETHPARLPPAVYFVTSNPAGEQRMRQVLDKLKHPRKPKACGNPECRGSSTISNEPSFGSGKLDDDDGFWEKPCNTCARKWEQDHPGTTAWPHAKKEGHSDTSPRKSD
jgi:hypothetical protein